MREYNHATAIAIQSLIQPRTWEMYSSISISIIRLKYASKTRASFPSIPSKEKKRRRMFLVLVEIIIVLVFLFLLSPIRERFHCLLLVGVSVRVPKYDVNDGASLNFL